MKRRAAPRGLLPVAPARRANQPAAACAEELKAIYSQPARGAAPHKHAGETHSAPPHAARARQPASARPRSSVPPARLTRRELAEVPLRDLVMIIQGLASEQFLRRHQLDADPARLAARAHREVAPRPPCSPRRTPSLLVFPTERRHGTHLSLGKAPLPGLCRGKACNPVPCEAALTPLSLSPPPPLSLSSRQVLAALYDHMFESGAWNRHIAAQIRARRRAAKGEKLPTCRPPPRPTPPSLSRQVAEHPPRARARAPCL